MLNLLITYMNIVPTHWCSLIFPVTELDMIVHGQVIFKSQNVMKLGSQTDCPSAVVAEGSQVMKI